MTSSRTTDVLKNLALVVGILILAVGAVGMLVPAVLVWIAQRSVTPGAFYVIAAVRVALGLVLISVASASRAPRMLRVLGYIILLAGVATALFGFAAIERARVMIDEWLQRGPGVIRVTGALILALGSFIAFACAPVRRAGGTILTCLTLFLGIASSARGQMETPKPAPELKKLDYFAGTWTTEGDIKPGPMGSGGKFRGTNHVRWMDGAFFLVTHSEFNGAMGKGAETSYMGYDGSDKLYTYDSFNTLGEADHAKGNVDGDTWTWRSETRMDAQTMKGRLTIKVLSATAYTFKFEMSPDGTSWTTVLEGKATKK